MKTMKFNLFICWTAIFLFATAMVKAKDVVISKKLESQIHSLKNEETIPLFIYLKDKGKNIEKKLAETKASLSTNSLQRRKINKNNPVTLNDVPVNAEYLLSISKNVKNIRHTLRGLNAISVDATKEQVESLVSLSYVAKIEKIKRLSRQPDLQLSNQPIIKGQDDEITKTGLSKIASPTMLDYGSSLTQNEQIHVPEVHELGYTGNGVVIAVFDTGFNRLSHESLNHLIIADSYDFVNDDNDVSNGSDMGEGSHGTNTLSTIGGFSESNLIGPAYGATYYLAKTENTESELHVEEDNWCAAAEWADINGAHIISSSLGYTDFDTGVDYSIADLDGDTTIVTKCADLTAENGVVIINSAGNSGPGITTIGAPSDGDSVIAVGAVTANDSLSSFSSVGPTSDGRIKPDVVAMGTSVVVASSISDTGYSFVNGTSFACPLTAGVAALIIEANPNLTAQQVRDILRNSADRSTSPDNSFGYGLINALSGVENALAAMAGNITPNASFAVTIDDSRGATFTNTSTDSDGSIVSFLWDFGDNVTDTAENPAHTYSADGTYTVSLTVTDNEGSSEEISRTVTVAESVTPDNPDPEPSSSSGGGATLFSIFLFGFFTCLRKVRP